MSPKMAKKRSLSCSICGDRAIGVNFNAASCMSCKVFFRRNALRHKELTCFFKGNCITYTSCTVLTRRFCGCCRLKKCLEAGMKIESICPSKPRSSRKRKQSIPSSLETNYDSNAQRSPLSESSSTTQIDSESEPETWDLSEEELLDALASSAEVASMLDDPIKPDYFTHLLTTPQEELTTSDPLFETFASVPPHQITPLFTSIGFPVQELLFTEKCHLQELANACSILQNHYRRLRHFPSDDNPVSISLISEHFMSRLIQMASRLTSSFGSLGSSDQQLMLQRRLLEMAAIRSVLMYDPDRKAWFTIDDKHQVTAMVPIALFRPFCTAHSYHRHRAFPGRFRDEWKRDSFIFDLLTAIVLFTPHEDYAQSNVVNEYFNRYTRLLNKYLIMTYGTEAEAAESYQILMENVTEMRTLNVDVQNFYREYREVFRGSPVFDQLLGGNSSEAASKKAELLSIQPNSPNILAVC